MSPGGPGDRLADKFLVFPSQIALPWLLTRSLVTVPIPGTREVAKPIPLGSQYSRTSAGDRSVKLCRFCTFAVGALCRACSSWSMLTLDKPMATIFLSSCESFHFLDLVGKEDGGVDSVQLKQVDLIEAAAAQAHQCRWRTYSVLPTGGQGPEPQLRWAFAGVDDAGSVAGQPGLGGD